MTLSYASAQALRHFLRGTDVPLALLDPQSLTAIEWIGGYRAEYGRMPSEQNLSDKFNVDLSELQGWEDVRPRLREEYVQRHFPSILRGCTEEIARAGSQEAGMIWLKQELDRMEQTMLEGAKYLPYVAGMDRQLTLQVNDVDGNYHPQIARFGLDQLDRFTNGVCYADYIIVYGKSSQGKSTFKRRITSSFIAQGKRVLSLALEEPAKLERLKQQSMDARVTAETYLRYEMPPAELWGIHQRLRQMATETRGELWIEDIDSIEQRSVAWLSNIVTQRRVDIVVIDQMTHWAETLEWKDIVKASMAARHFTLKGTPIIMLHQSDDKGQIKYGKVIFENATKVLKLGDNPKEPTEQKKLFGPKNRDGIKDFGIALQWDPGQNLCEEIRPHTAVYRDEEKEGPAPEAGEAIAPPKDEDLKVGQWQ